VPAARPAPEPEPRLATHSLRSSLVEDVTERLREALLNGDVSPGQRLLMRELEERFGVSHIPIREALRRLEAEGLVENVPQRGAVATPISLEQLAELYDLRRIIECRVAARAVPGFTPERLAALRDAFARLDAVAGDPGSDAFLQAHREFHWAMLAPGASDLIERTLRQLWQGTERYVRLSATRLHTAETARAQHRHLLELCERGDRRRLSVDMGAHLHVTEDAIRHQYEKQAAHGTEDAPVARGNGRGRSRK